eukprot:400479_1
MSAESDEHIPIILDTDIGVDIDDDLAVLTLLGIIKNYNRQNNAKSIKLCAITTVGFCTSLKALQCKILLKSNNHNPFVNIIPVFAGSSNKLNNGWFNPFIITNIIFIIFYLYSFIINCFNCFSEKQSHTKYMYSNRSMNAIDALIYFAKKCENTNNKLHIICIGPLTNIAKAIKKDNQFLDRINSITIMGGLLGYTLNKDKQLIVDNDHGGKSGFLITDVRDTNLRSDKYSFNFIFGFAEKNKLLHKLVLVPVDMTLKIYLTPKDSKLISKWIDMCIKNSEMDNKMLKYIQCSFIPWSYAQIFIWKCDRNECYSYLHDPLTVCVALLWNNLILDAQNNEFECKFNGIGYCKQNDMKKHTLSQSTLLEEYERKCMVDYAQNDSKDICHILTDFDVQKMKMFVLKCIESAVLN